MLISKEEAERRLSSPKNIINSLGLKGPVSVKAPPVPVKKETTPRLSDTNLRVVAGTEAHFAPAKEVAESLGITEQQVRSAKNSLNGNIRERIERSVECVQELALRRTLETLEMLSQEEISGEKPRDRAAIAASLSKVYSNTSRGSSTGAAAPVQFIVYAPQIKAETHYDTIEAGVA